VLPAVVGVLYAPLAAFFVVGVVLFCAVWRGISPTVLRLAAMFLALWAVLATTVLVWVVAHGGTAGIVQLLRTPGAIFEPQFEDLWLAGAIGALGVFTAAFAINQAVGRGFLRLLNPHPIPWPAGLALPRQPIQLFAFPGDRPDAFSFTLLGHSDGPRSRWGRREVILVSSGLLLRLTPEERAAAVAHELGHLRGLDGRYLTFFRTLARIVRWDPVVGYVAHSLTRREEFRADAEAARLTGHPLAMARALFKASLRSDPVRHPTGAASLIGSGGWWGNRETLERIRRLVELSESGAFGPPEHELP
jgi:Zn-dependent protease with chaperone function